MNFCLSKMQRSTQTENEVQILTDDCHYEQLLKLRPAVTCHDNRIKHVNRFDWIESERHTAQNEIITCSSSSITERCRSGTFSAERRHISVSAAKSWNHHRAKDAVFAACWESRLKRVVRLVTLTVTRCASV